MNAAQPSAQGRRLRLLSLGVVNSLLFESTAYPRIATLDGGLVRAFSSLFMLQSLLRHVHDQENRLRQLRNEPQLTESPKVCEYFDIIGGSNTGGYDHDDRLVTLLLADVTNRIIALMVGRLEMDIDVAIGKAYRLLGRVFSPSEETETAEGRSAVLEEELKTLVEEELGNREAMLLAEGGPVNGCKT